MKLIITANLDDWVLAIRAAKSFLENDYSNSAIIAYENDAKFLVTKNKSSLSVRQEGVDA